MNCSNHNAFYQNDTTRKMVPICLKASSFPKSTQQKMICYMRCVDVFFIDITNIFVNMTDFSCHFNQKDTLRIPNECLCVILTFIFLLCMSNNTQTICNCFTAFISL